ncbi:MAG: hypothetical protein ACREX0_06280 [Noviherbaspirillum sp.]
MSEYQYYEFVAIDRPLTREEMAELRSRSSRATITATHFVNDYQWGDLKGDPADWMRRYFDAFVYTANWGNCRLALRLPHAAFRKSELKQFAAEYALTVDDAKTHWIIKWELTESEDDDRFAMETGQGWMGSLAPLRDELLRGDLRPLYLGWLAGVTAGEIDADALEPEVPPGLSRLSGAQESLADFLEIDPDLLSAAAAGSAAPAAANDEKNIDAWLSGLSASEMRTALKMILQDPLQQAERQIKSRFLAWQKDHAQGAAPSSRQRTVAELRALAEKAETQRLKREAQERKRREAERRQEREAHLKTLAKDFDRCWNAIDSHAERGVASGYDKATDAIADLAEAYALVSRKKAFDQSLSRFMERHGKRGALVRRLTDAGLWQK